MKYLIFINNSTGITDFRMELLSELLKSGEVVISVPNNGTIDLIKKVGAQIIDTDINWKSLNPFVDIDLMIKYRNIIKKEKPDLVLTYTIKPNVYGGLACQMTGTPYFANITGLGTSIENGGLLSKLSTTLYRIGLRKANCVFFKNASNKKLFEDRKYVSGKTRLIPGSGVNLDVHTPEAYPEEDGQIRFLFIGRVMKDKGIGELLAAIRDIHARHNEVSLDIVGGYDENYSGQVDEIVKEGYVRYHGQQPNVHEYIKNSHCTVLPSYHEGMANVMLESASTCRPVITTTVPGCRETFDDDVTGLSCEAKSTESLIAAMEKFIALPYEKKAQMGIAGRKKVELEFDRKLVVEAYMEEIEKATR